jgi:hypothetical protein
VYNIYGIFGSMHFETLVQGLCIHFIMRQHQWLDSNVAIWLKSCIIQRSFRALVLQSTVAAIQLGVSLWHKVLLVLEKMCSFLLSIDTLICHVPL